MLVRLVLPVALFAASAAYSATIDQPDASQPAAEKKVCKRDLSTGSIMPKRICRTKAEWAAIEVQQKSQSDRVNSDGERGMRSQPGN